MSICMPNLVPRLSEVLDVGQVTIYLGEVPCRYPQCLAETAMQA